MKSASPEYAFREIGLSINGLLEIGDRLPVANYRKLVPKIPSSQIGFVCLRIKRERAGRATVGRD